MNKNYFIQKISNLEEDVITKDDILKIFDKINSDLEKEEIIKSVADRCVKSYSKEKIDICIGDIYCMIGLILAYNANPVSPNILFDNRICVPIEFCEERIFKLGETIDICDIFPEDLLHSRHYGNANFNQDYNSSIRELKIRLDMFSDMVNKL